MGVPRESDEPRGAATRAGDESVCNLCGKPHPRRVLRHARGVRPAVAGFLARKYPDRWKSSALACPDCLNRERLAYLLENLAEDRGELSAIESEVARKAVDHLAVAEQVEEEFRRAATIGQRLADSVARVGGSWPFVIVFIALLLAWTAFNTWWMKGRAFDPYPYILLNLVLSCIAALQAPVIMMSQNRMSKYDRAKADQDFRVNLKAELEVASLHDKVDHLLHAQWEHLVEMQEVQIDLLNQIVEKNAKKA
jgi:uncharacterized membrane protein